MKRILFFLSVFVSAVLVAQPHYQTNATNFNFTNHVKVGKSLVIPLDTLSSAPDSALAIKSGVIYQKLGYWVQVAGTPGTQANELISGGSVTPLGGYLFAVQEAIYRIDNVIYASDSGTVTIDSTDATLNRIDRIYLATDAAFHVLKGELATNALEPQLENDHIGLAFITIPAGNDPSITTLVVYDENTGESTVTNLTTTTDPNNATNTYTGSKSLNVTNINDATGAAADEVNLTRPTGNWNVLGFDGLSMFIKLKEAMPATGNLRVTLMVGTQAVSSEVLIALNKNNTTTFQAVTVSAAAFGNITNTSVTRVRIRYTRPGNAANYTGFYLDNMFFIDGVTQPTPGSNVSITLNPPVGFSVSPTSTINNTGVWNMTPVGYSSLDNFYSPDGWQSLPQILSAIGTIDGRSKTANGAEVDEEEIFLQTVDATYPGLATPEMYDIVYNYIVQQYYLQNLGNGDTLAIPINDTVIGIKSIKFGTVWGITDSTILIDTSGEGSTGFFHPNQTSVSGNTVHISDFSVRSFGLYGTNIGEGNPRRFYMDGTTTQLGSPDGDTKFTVYNGVFEIETLTPATSMEGRTVMVYNVPLLRWEHISKDSVGGGGGDSSIYSADGTLAGNRALALDGKTLNFNQAAIQFLSITPTANSEESVLQAYNLTGSDNYGRFIGRSSDTDAEFELKSSFNGGAETATIGGLVASGLSELTYTADTHTIYGDIIYPYPTVPGTASSTGTTGQIAWDTGYVYICTATNTWKRVAIVTW